MSTEADKLTWHSSLTSEFFTVFGRMDSMNCARVCLERNPELLEIRDKNGCNLLHACIYQGSYPKFVELLMEYGMDPDHKNNDGHTPRQCARGLWGCDDLYHTICRFKPSPDLDDPIEKEKHKLHQARKEYPDSEAFYAEMEKLNLKQLKRNGTFDGAHYDDLDEELKTKFKQFE